jgi:hypothetical protein
MATTTTIADNLAVNGAHHTNVKSATQATIVTATSIEPVAAFTPGSVSFEGKIHCLFTPPRI